MTAPDHRPIKILLVEDNPADVRLIRAMLKAARGGPFDLEHVDRLEPALERLAQGGVDIALLDLTLPDSRGLETFTSAHAHAPDVSIVVLTALDDENLAATAVRLGAQDYLVKGQVDANLLSQTVRYAIERKQAHDARTGLEHQLRQAHKMEAVGRLAGGVAHDFNNLLTVIVGHSALLLARLKPTDALRQHVELIDQTAARANRLTRQLLAFSRQQILQPLVLDVNEVVTGVREMLTRLLGEDIELVTRLRSPLPPVHADLSQMEQVLVNLAVNARDAMPRGGHLAIETASVELDRRFSQEHDGARPGRYVMLAVSDTGVGMAPEVQAQIFEPFFTTKGVGRGTGLGLATVYGIVKQHAGYVTVASDIGRGSTFRVYLPQTEASVSTRPAPAPPAELRGGTETILLVEDEDTVRDLARQVLEAYGYTVIQARSPSIALLVGEQRHTAVHLLLTDVVMPQMSGRELADRLVGPLSTTRVLYMSGYTNDAVTDHGVLDSAVALLEKPFTPDDLVRKVREVLDAPLRRPTA
jgi:signal transduction histidine kinase